MALLPLLLYLGSSATGGTPQTSRLAEVKAAVQPVMDQQSQLFNSSLSFGFADSSGVLGLAAGLDDIWKKTPLSPDALVPGGSTTKPWTAIAILQEVEAGRIGLEDKAVQWVDPLLQKINGTTMTELWRGSRWPIGQVTIRNLLQHTSGIMEYDDFLPFNVNHPDSDLSPLDILHLVPKHLVCNPSNCTC